MRWRTSGVLQSTTGNDERNGRAQECQVCADEGEDVGHERLQGILIVIAFAFVVWTSLSNASSPISSCVGAPRGLAAFLRPPLPRSPRVWEDLRSRDLPLGRAASIILLYMQWVGEGRQVFGEHDHEHIFITNIFMCICTTMDLPSMSATAERRRIGRRRRAGERVATFVFGSSTHRWPHWQPSTARCVARALRQA